jgi:zinc transport system ATP-binding protein
MQDLAKRQIGKLSGGELQRVLIARALATEATLLLFDEPTSSLDTRIGHTVYHVLEELNKTVTIILVSHDVGVVSSHVKSIACINRKLHFHPAKEITGEMLEEVYGCPLEFLAHGHAHRVLPEHGGDK